MHLLRKLSMKKAPEVYEFCPFERRVTLPRVVEELGLFKKASSIA